MSRDDRKQLLMVEDDPLFVRSVKKVLEGKYEVATAGKVSEAIELLAKDPPDLILLDMMLPGESGMALLYNMKDRFTRLPVIALTAVDRISNVVEAMRAGAINYLTKPVSFDELLLAIEGALEASEIRGEVERRRDLQLVANRERSILGDSAAIEKVRREIATIAPTDATVLVEGETGTGKELVARAIHAASPRASGPFVAVNCGAIPKDLFESEFFGHRKGAFTGAQADTRGKLRLAHRGTLLLDEIGELPLDAQVKFLRAVEEQEFFPVGSSELVRVDTRVVASTHRDLREMIEEGAFREDLFFRLNVFQITIPPLRERPEDVLALARHFIGQFSRRFRKQPGRLDAGAEKLLTAYPWKGNVRELRNVVERVTLLGSGDKITGDDLGVVLGHHTPAPAGAAFALPEEGLDLDELEKALMQQALERAAGNKSRAARLLKMSSATFYYRIDKHGLG
ncbi:MAG: sigma-54-dependent Fis family transcriptional regulator [bacterium]|nr:sigma-54-dependent Fis family transcriptional regulator [bacterium]